MSEAPRPDGWGSSPLGLIPTEWEIATLAQFAASRPGCFVNGPFGSDLLTSELTDSGVPVIYSQDVKGDGYRRISDAHITEEKANELAICNVKSGDVLVAKVGNPPGVAAAYTAQQRAVITQDVIRIRPAENVVAQFLASLLNSSIGVRAIQRITIEGTRARVSLTEFKGLRLPKPVPEEQRRIAEILSTLDEAIERTEGLIGKLQQIKAGLMHDLFTRGVTPASHLRPPRDQAPHLYKPSPLGWIPNEWETKPLASVADSLVDGPFGSNLKSEHYVVEPGVRVVRLQNIQEGEYNDQDRAFISIRHAEYLARNTVIAGDVLIAALGDENYPVGRACVYPSEFPPAINKADCFRLRCNPTLALNAFVSHFLNTTAARTQVKRFEQGVTRRRTNLGNFRRVFIALPSTVEQRLIVEMLTAISLQTQTCRSQLEKLRQQKHGLMHDLLTGRVRVPVAAAAEGGSA